MLFLNAEPVVVPLLDGPPAKMPSVPPMLTLLKKMQFLQLRKANVV